MRAKAQQYFSASQRIDQLVQFLPHHFHVRIDKDRIQRVHDVGLVARLVQRVEHRVVEVVVRHLASWALGTLWTLRTIVALRASGHRVDQVFESVELATHLHCFDFSVGLWDRWIVHDGDAGGS